MFFEQIPAKFTLFFMFYGGTALMRALEDKNDVLSLYLIINDSDLNSKDKNGKRVLSKNGVGLKLEDIEIKIKKGQDTKQVKEILDELLMKKKNIVVYDIKRIDIINQEGGHKIILREKDGKACLRYSCRKEQDGYKFDDVQKKDRRGLLKRLQKVKKLIQFE